MDVEGSRVWFTDLWNYSIIPYMLEAIREGLQVNPRGHARTTAAYDGDMATSRRLKLPSFKQALKTNLFKGPMTCHQVWFD